MENRSIGQIFMFFNCTMARDIPKMGKILKLNILEILGHPSVWAMEEEDTKQRAPIMNPIEERDKTIMELNATINNLKENEANTIFFKSELQKMEEENQKMRKKLNYTRKATEQRIVENITNKESYREDPLLVAVMSATLDEDEVDLENDEETDASGHLSRKVLFSTLGSKLDEHDELQQERLSHLKSQVLEKLKITKSRRSSISGKRRLPLQDPDDSSLFRSPSRLRTSSNPDQLLLPETASSDAAAQSQE